MKAPWFHRLQLTCDKLLSRVAFKVNLRRYTTEANGLYGTAVHPLPLQLILSRFVPSFTLSCTKVLNQCLVWYRSCGIEVRSTNQNSPKRKSCRRTRSNSDRVTILE